MSKTEIVTELQTILNDLKGITADLEQNISGLKDFLEDRKFIPKELGASIREQLEAIDAKQTEIVSKYEMLDVQKPEMQHTAIEENLSEIQKVIEENEKYRKAIAFFLELHADDEKTAETLQNRKDRIAADQIQLMEGDILKEYAEPYAWLQQAFWEKDARRKFSLIYKLVPHFEEEIVTGIHFNTLKLDENKAEPEESVPEAFCAETDSADREKEETAENTAEVLEEPEECPEAWKDLLIPEDSSLLHVQMSAKAGTKFGVKEFRKDMCKQPLTGKMCCLLECIEEHGYSVKSLAEKNDNGYEIYKTATEKLYQSGYLKRYIVDGMGEFFTLSPRGERILYTKEAVGFINQMLKEKISNQDEGEHIEDSTNSAMTRLMAYDSACKQRILFPDYEFDTCNSVFGTDYFMIGYSMNGKKNFQWFAGVVTEDPAELQEFKDVVAEKAGAEESLVVYGVSLEHLESLTVKPFKAMEARELLEVPLSYLGFRFPEDNETEVLISTILGTTNYFPGLLQLYCTKLIEAMQRDYAGYSESETPPYLVKKEHIKKVLAEQTLQEEIRKKFFITLVVGDDDYYYIIALMVAYLYHENKSENGCSADELLELAEGYSIKKILTLGKEQLAALMEEMRELYVLQNTSEGRYRFTRYSFCQMMGTIPQINDELEKYMED